MRAVVVTRRGRGRPDLHLCDPCRAELGLDDGASNAVQWGDRETGWRVTVLTTREARGRACDACAIRLAEPHVHLPENVERVVQALAGPGGDEFAIRLALKRAETVTTKRQPQTAEASP